MQKAKRKRILRFVYIIGTILIIALIGVFDQSFMGMFEAMGQLNLFWLWMGIVCLICFWISDSILLSHITSYIHTKIPSLLSLKLSIIGLYYGALTPFATGGQPMQVVYMKKEDITYGTATCIVTTKFIIYELSLCLFYIVAMFFRGAYFYTNYNQVFWFTTLGFIVNLSAVIFIIFVMVNRDFATRICKGFVGFLHRIKIIKRPEKVLKTLNTNIEEFHDSTDYIVKYKWQVAISVILSIINLAFLFAIPYFIYVAFGHSEKTIIDLITMQSFLYLAVSFVPMPGAAGASEGGFYLFFSAYFTKVPVFVAMLVWRFLSYYTILIVGSLLVVVDEVINLKKQKNDSTNTEKLQ
ncbi:MAG: flippase-like domain-containing protein [Clostridiales bacterium]|nr:flippase-like domain-containing protein [Clostridiales bacterium]